MMSGKPIDELIRAGWDVIDSDYHPVAFQHWRHKAYACLVQLLGSDHVYTQYFREFIREPRPKDSLTGTGILAAVKEEMAKRRLGVDQREHSVAERH